MEGLFLKVLSPGQSKPRLMRIAEVRINDESTRTKELKLRVGSWMPINKQPKLDGAAYRYLKCVHCQHEDFSEDAERLCDYVCNGCGLTTGVVFRKGDE